MKQLFTIPLLGLSLLVSSAALATQTCNANMLKTKPNSIYSDNAGTVTDTKTRLMWQKCSVGQTYSAGTCTGTATTATWEAALKAANTATQYGYSDWRVPNIKELASLVEEACYDPAINEKLFPNTATSGYYWSASPGAFNGNEAKVVSFPFGYVSSSNNIYLNYVRLVRSGL